MQNVQIRGAIAADIPFWAKIQYESTMFAGISMINGNELMPELVIYLVRQFRCNPT
jgi:hypothetical protein